MSFHVFSGPTIWGLVLTLPASAATMQGVTPTPEISFQSRVDHPLLGSSPEWVATGDFDGLNGPDFAVTTHETDGNGGTERVEIFLIQSSGSFTEGQAIALGVDVGVAAIVAADLDGDEDVDLAVSLMNSGSVSVLLNTGTGFFVPGDSFAIGGSDPRHMAGGDLDADGDIDLVTSNRESDDVSVLLNRGDATFGVPLVVPVGPEPLHLAVEDLDRDCDLDVAVVLGGTSEVAILINMGIGGVLQPIVPEAFAGQVEVHLSGITAADLDADGDVDLAVTTREGSVLSACVLTNDGGASFTLECYDTATRGGPIVPQEIGSEVTFDDAILAADLNGDGNKDLALTDVLSHRVHALHGMGEVGFGHPVAARVEGQPSMIASGDFDENGSIDLVTSNRMSETASVLINVTEGGTHTFCGTSPNSIGPGARLDSTGSVSIAAEEFTLMVRCARPGQTGLFFYGADQTSLPFGAGQLCIGPPLFRLPPAVKTDSSGDASRRLDFDDPPAGHGAGEIVAGSTWNFQFWYRDVAKSIRPRAGATQQAGAAVWNLTEALSATFRP